VKLWKKQADLDKRIERFTVDDDYVWDQQLIAYDCIASKAHATMLHAIGVLNSEEHKSLIEGLDEIMAIDAKGEFTIVQADEDCHTAIENFLTKRCGEAGKKIHTGRSRNDQVLTALRLFEKTKLQEVRERLLAYRRSLQAIIDRWGETAMPGYTHMQRAMPTTVGMWMGCFRDAVDDNIRQLEAVATIVDQSPLGTAAGFGVPVLTLDREMTARQMGFARVLANPIYAQMSRGKCEAAILGVLGQITFDLCKLATDLILFSTKEFGFVLLPEQACTGSSIMPQKRNPDVLELLRAKYHDVLGEEIKVKSMIANLMSGYNRDMQLTKGPLMRGLATTLACLEVAVVVLDGMHLNVEALRAAMSDELYATERAYRLVQEGMPFRDAYFKVAAELHSVTSKPPAGSSG
jgi:argininosuccinate lyase